MSASRSAQGEIVTLIGANGAGKSTLLMTICGSPRASEGRIVFEGHDITGLTTYDIVSCGISQSPEGRRIFPRMTVHENLQMGAVPTGGAHFEEDVERVFTLFPRLKERLHQRGGTLSGGEQQMLAIGRALMARPGCCCSTSPRWAWPRCWCSRSSAPSSRSTAAEGLTILLVEQNAYQALRIAHRAYVLARPVAWSCRAAGPSSWPIPRCGQPISRAVTRAAMPPLKSGFSHMCGGGRGLL